MGEYADLKIRKMSLFSFKNYLSGGIVNLFFSSKDYECIPNYTEYIDDDDEPYTYTKHTYRTTVKKARDRLEALGFSIKKFEDVFNVTKKQAICYDDYLYCSNTNLQYDENTMQKRIERITFAKWKNAVNRIVKYQLEHGEINEFNQLSKEYISKSTDSYKFIYYSLINNENFTYYGLDTTFIPMEFSIRLILEYCDPSLEVILDFSNLENWSSESIEWAIEASENVEKTIVLVEGETDKNILEFALNRFYPNLTDLFYFMDFDDNYGGKREGGSSFIIKNLKTFYFSKIKSRFIAIFDNDAEGYSCKCALENEIKNWPDNFRILLYPPNKLFISYPTILPNGTIYNDNINKKACSIEVYLPDELIKTNGTYYPIEWESRKKIKTETGKTEYIYQGVISQKNEVNKGFNSFKKKIESGKMAFIAKDWERMKQIIDSIVFAFTT